VTLYRVFPFDGTARPTDPGGPMFASRSGFGRIGNPDLYQELYLSTAAAGAISEAFGRLDSVRHAAVQEAATLLPRRLKLS
jgi:hypothetical protein